jgi:hypothetical protein
MIRTYKNRIIACATGLSFLVFLGLLVTLYARENHGITPAPPFRDTEQIESASGMMAVSEVVVSKDSGLKTGDYWPAVVETEQEKHAAGKPPHENLYCFFTDIDGWKQGAPTGRSLISGGGIMTSCEYRRGESERFTTKVIHGLLAKSTLRTVEAVKRLPTNSKLIHTYHLDNLPVTLHQDTVTKKNWVLTAVLDKSCPAVIQMTFVDIEPVKCLELAMSFDFMKLKEALNTISSIGPEAGSGMPSEL